MPKLVFSTKRKTIYQLMEEVVNQNPVSSEIYTENGVEIIKSKYKNGLWVKEITHNRRRIKNYSAKIGDKIIKTQIVEYIIPSQDMAKSLGLEVRDMFNKLEGSVWL